MLCSLPCCVGVHEIQHSCLLCFTHALLCRDAQDNVMGGYGSDPWQKSGSFFGGHSTCVFSLAPALQVCIFCLYFIFSFYITLILNGTCTASMYVSFVFCLLSIYLRAACNIHTASIFRHTGHTCVAHPHISYALLGTSYISNTVLSKLKAFYTVYCRYILPPVIMRWAVWLTGITKLFAVFLIVRWRWCIIKEINSLKQL
jgi:hypothetical protein